MILYNPVWLVIVYYKIILYMSDKVAFFYVYVTCMVHICVHYLFSVPPLSSSLDEIKCHFQYVIKCLPHLSVGKHSLKHFHQPWKVTCIRTTYPVKFPALNKVVIGKPSN